MRLYSSLLHQLSHIEEVDALSLRVERTTYLKGNFLVLVETGRKQSSTIMMKTTKLALLLVGIAHTICHCSSFQGQNWLSTSPTASLFGSRRTDAMKKVLSKHRYQSTTTTTTTTISATNDEEIVESDTAKNLKQTLIATIEEFRQLKQRDGEINIDFGVKGGELNETTRAPQKVDFYGISKDVGDKATEIIQICKKLSDCSPVDEPTRYLGDKENGYLAPLNGPWKLLFSTAADANFSKDSKRGAATVQNIVNATKGTITNVIDFADKEDGTEPVLKQLNVVIRATAVNPKRVELQFRYAKAILTKLFFLKVRWPLYIPVPAPFITRCIVFLSRLFKFGKKGVKTIPKAYFDVLYLDKDLRIHQTGEDNTFIQARESWQSAKPLLE